MRPTSTNFHPAGLMSAPDILAMAEAPAPGQAQCRRAYKETDRSILVVVIKSGEDVRETVVAANLPKCALGHRQGAKIYCHHGRAFDHRVQRTFLAFEVSRRFSFELFISSMQHSFKGCVLTKQQHNYVWLHTKVSVSRFSYHIPFSRML